jgi:hypothetical protein
MCLQASFGIGERALQAAGFTGSALGPPLAAREHGEPGEKIVVGQVSGEGEDVCLHPLYVSRPFSRSG